MSKGAGGRGGGRGLLYAEGKTPGRDGKEEKTLYKVCLSDVCAHQALDSCTPSLGTEWPTGRWGRPGKRAQRPHDLRTCPNETNSAAKADTDQPVLCAGNQNRSLPTHTGPRPQGRPKDEKGEGA